MEERETIGVSIEVKSNFYDSSNSIDECFLRAVILSLNFFFSMEIFFILLVIIPKSKEITSKDKQQLRERN